MSSQLTYLLLQVRNPDDPMRGHEIECFARELQCPTSNILIEDLLTRAPSRDEINRVDAVLLGGSGDYSVAAGGRWMDPAMEAMRELHERRTPTFASCWGFQAMAAALGGDVVTDHDRAEVGTFDVTLTDAGMDDPVFGPCGRSFAAQLGHEDIVDSLPTDAILLASSDRVTHQAFTFPERPIYATQFHPELAMSDLRMRLERYPKYAEEVAGIPADRILDHLRPSPESSSLLRRFADVVLMHA